MVQEMRVELQYSPVTSSGTEKTQSGFLPSHQTHNLTPTCSASTAHTHTLSQPHTIALATMGSTSKIHSAALLLPDIIPLTLFAFNLSPHTQPTRAIMEIQNRASVARSKIRPWVICTRFCPTNRSISRVIQWYCNHGHRHCNNKLFSNRVTDTNRRVLHDLCLSQKPECNSETLEEKKAHFSL